MPAQHLPTWSPPPPNRASLLSAALLALILLPEALYSQDRWLDLVATDSGFRLAVDTLTARELGPAHYQVWVRELYPKQHNVLGIKYTSNTQLLDFDCENRKMRVLKFSLFDKKGKRVFVSESPTPEQEPYFSVEPETLNEIRYIHVCAFMAHPETPPKTPSAVPDSRISSQTRTVAPRLCPGFETRFSPSPGTQGD